MKKNIIHWFQFVLCMSGLLCIPIIGHAQTEEEPIVTLYTNIYEQSGSTNSFQIMLGGISEQDYIDIDCGWGKDEVELVPASFDSETQEWSGTFYTCNVTSKGVVRIYGDASNIDVLSINGAYIRQIDFSTLTNLEILDLSHNELEALDLTPFTKLKALYLDDNPFNKSPLIVGAPKPNLYILEMGQTDNLNPSFNLSDYPEMISFNAWNNKGLKTLDPSGCPKLMKISIDGTMVKELDVTNNTNLQILNISETGIMDINLEKNISLLEFYCDRQSSTDEQKLRTLDVSKNVNLVRLFANGNRLESIDLRNNTYLQDLYISNNRLTSIDISNNTNLLNLAIRGNYFNFATLPLPQTDWSNYDYYQNNMPIAKTFKVGDVIDFSDKVLRDGTITTMALFTVSEENPNSRIELTEDYYTFTDGKLTLLKAVSDSVYAAFANDAFPEITLNEMPLRTDKFLIKSAEDFGQDDEVLVFSTQSEGCNVEFRLGMFGATPENPKKFYVDFGDDIKREYTANGHDIPTTANAQGTSITGTVTVYVPEGELVSALAIEDIALKSIDLSALHEMNKLKLTGTLLTNIDLGWNKRLKELVLTGNNFGTLNIRGVNDFYQKTLLQDIDLSDNQLTSVTLNDNYTIHNLNLSKNKLKELSFKDADMLETLDMSNNQLTAIDLNYCTLLTHLNIADNDIASISLPTENSLRELHCEGNALSFATLPVLPDVEVYTYMPQDIVSIPEIGPGADLSAHDLNGQTDYTWKKTNGTLLHEGTDYTLENGKTRFCENVIGEQAYCEMTNPMFSGLTLTTSVMKIAGMPTNLLGSFTSTTEQTAKLVLASSAESTNICIDWKGDGVELENYIIGTSPTIFEVSTQQNATAKVYSYDEDSKLTVFSITGVAMADADFTNMKQLVCLTVKQAGLLSIKLPDAPDLFELYLDGNNLTDIDLKKFTNLQYLTLNNNKLTTFDASRYPKLLMFSASGNGMQTVKLDNENLWSLDLSSNMLTEVDLTHVNGLEQLSLASNQLEHIDVSNLERLRVLYLDHNRFKFSTLPLTDGFQLYTYADQAAVPVEVIDGQVDLSTEAIIDNTPTTYRWFVDMPYYDEYDELTGEELYVDDEFVVNNGVTTFLTVQNDVVCAMTNDKFPKLVLYTPLIDVTTTGIEHVTGTDKNPFSIDENTITVKVPKGQRVSLYRADGGLVDTAISTSGSPLQLTANGKGVFIVKTATASTKIVIK